MALSHSMRLYPVGTIYSVVVATQPTGQTCSVAGGSGYLTNVNYGGVVVSCSAVTSKASRGGSTLTSAVEALANRRSGDVLYLTCLDVIDEITALANPVRRLGLPVRALLGHDGRRVDIRQQPGYQHPLCIRGAENSAHRAVERSAVDASCTR